MKINRHFVRLLIKTGIVFGVLCTAALGAVSFHAAGSTTNSASASFTVAVPTVSNNDVVLLFLVNQVGLAGTSGSTWTLPSGYTACYNNRGYAAAYHLWQTGDSTSLGITRPTGSGTWSSGTALTWSGVDTSTPVDLCSQVGYQYGSLGVNTVDARAPNVFPNYANDWLVVDYMDASASGAAFSLVSPPGTFTSRKADTSGPNTFVWDETLTTNSPTGSVNASQTGTASDRFGVSILLHASGDPSTGRKGPVASWIGVRQQDAVSSFDLTPFPVQNNDFVVISCIGATPRTVSTTGYTTVINGTNIAVYTHLWLTGDATTVNLSGSGSNCALNVYRNLTTATAITVDASNIATTTGTSVNSPSLAVACLDLLQLDYYVTAGAGVTWNGTPSGTNLNWFANSNNADSTRNMESFVESPTNPTGSFTASQAGVSEPMAASAMALKISGGVGCSGGGMPAVYYFPQMR